MWLRDCFWHFLFVIVLIVIMVIWRPSANRNRFAYSLVNDLDQEDEEEEERMENKNFGENLNPTILFLPYIFLPITKNVGAFLAHTYFSPLHQNFSDVCFRDSKDEISKSRRCRHTPSYLLHPGCEESIFRPLLLFLVMMMSSICRKMT